MMRMIGRQSCTVRCSAVCRVPSVHAAKGVRAIVPARRDVRAAFFKFGKNGMGAEDAGIMGAQGRDDYIYDDVEQYFNYMVSCCC